VTHCACSIQHPFTHRLLHRRISNSRIRPYEMASSPNRRIPTVCPEKFFHGSLAQNIHNLFAPLERSYFPAESSETLIPSRLPFFSAQRTLQKHHALLAGFKHWFSALDSRADMLMHTEDTKPKLHIIFQALHSGSSAVKQIKTQSPPPFLSYLGINPKQKT
jgi:hypothetical protein